MDVEGARIDMSRALARRGGKRTAWATCLGPGDRVQARTALGAASWALSQWLSTRGSLLRLGRALPKRSLPHKGRGKREARIFAPHTMCSRTDIQRCVTTGKLKS